MFPKTGNQLPNRAPVPSEAEFLGAVRQALREELGGSRAVTKSIMRWTGTCDRTARNWMSGTAQPSGYHLFCLARGSKAVWAIFVAMSGRTDFSLSEDLHAVEVALAKAQGALEILKRHRLKQKRD